MNGQYLPDASPSRVWKKYVIFCYFMSRREKWSFAVYTCLIEIDETANSCLLITTFATRRWETEQQRGFCWPECYCRNLTHGWQFEVKSITNQVNFPVWCWWLSCYFLRVIGEKLHRLEDRLPKFRQHLSDLEADHKRVSGAYEEMLTQHGDTFLAVSRNIEMDEERRLRAREMEARQPIRNARYSQHLNSHTETRWESWSGQ